MEIRRVPSVRGVLTPRDDQLPPDHALWSDADRWEWAGALALQAGAHHRALDALARCLAIEPRRKNANDNLVFLLDQLTAATAGQRVAARRKWWRNIGLPYAARRYRWPVTVRREGEPLRIGYLTGDARTHSAMNVSLLPLLTQGSPRFRNIVFSSTPRLLWDSFTDWLRVRAGFVDVSELGQIETARAIVHAGCDVLVDLSGPTRYNRLGALCTTPAPVCVAGMGYAIPYGLPVLAGFFTDPYCHVEPTVERRLDLTYCLPYWPASPQALLGDPPVRDPAAPFTFGSFARVGKVTPATLDLWAAVLRAVPTAQFLVKDHTYDQAEPRALVLEGLRAREISPARIAFEGSTPLAEHLARYHAVDCVLDSYPQGGGVSTLEALAQGVPVVTLRGDRVSSRTTARALEIVFAEQWVTLEPAHYVDRAVRLARRDFWLRDAKRHELRAAFRRSPICDGTIVREIETWYDELTAAPCG